MSDSRDTNRDGHVSLMEKVKDKLHLGNKDKDAEYTTHHTSTTTSHNSTSSHHSTTHATTSHQAVMPVAGLVPVAGVIPVAGALDSRDLNRDGHVSATERLASDTHMNTNHSDHHMGTHTHMGTNHTGHMGHASAQNETVMRLHEEQLAVSKREVGAGGVDIHKRVQEEHVQQTIPVRREEVVVERRPLHGAADPNARIAAQDEHVRVPLYREELMTEKRIVPTEEVIVRKNEVLGEQTVGATLRSEYVETSQSGVAHGASAVSPREKRRLDARDTNLGGHVSTGEKLKSASASKAARG